MNLTKELILYIIRNLLSEKDQQAIATCNKKLWNIATIPCAKSITLKHKISSLTIRRIVHLLIEKGFYKPELIKHVLTFAINLRDITFEEREKFPVKFVQYFMPIKRSCEFFVPLKAYNVFMLLAEDSENKYITVKFKSIIKEETVKTPEVIQRKVEIFKSAEKAKYIANTDNTFIMKNQLSHLVPYHVNRLLNTNEYVVYDNSHPEAEITSEEQANSIVSFCSRFMEAVVILENYWFFSTSFSIFIHNKNIDDCADNSRVGIQEQAVSFIRKKTRAGNDYFELTIRFNNVELLSTSGFFGNVNSNTITAFVGSSIRSLPSLLTKRYDTVSSKCIFIPATTAPCTKVERLLNQYVKKHAANKWMLISTKFEEQGFTPNHPLSFTETNNVNQKAASLLLKVFMNKTLFKDGIKTAALDLQKSSVKALTASETLIKKYILNLNSMDDFLDETYNITQVKKDMLYIYERTLAGVLKRKNEDIAKKAEIKYNPAKVNLFDEDA